MSISAPTAEPAAPRSRRALLARAVLRELPLLAVLAALLAEPATRDFALVNLAVQALLFTLGACLPAHRTGVMAFADIAWPWGLVALGVQAIAFGGGSAIVLVVACAYLVMGLRMAAFGYLFFTSFPRDDLPRYRYRRMVWRREGYRSQTIPMQHEILHQGLVNASYVALPAALAVADPGAPIGALVVVGALVWAASWVLESVADAQKARYAGMGRRRGRARTCDVGLWRYSRHPNYFFQWMQWNGLILVSLPAVVRLADELAPLAWVVLAAGTLGISAAFYHILVHYTGAVPAEHFSVRHRPGYAGYQRRVNRFFPGPPAR